MVAGARKDRGLHTQCNIYVRVYEHSLPRLDRDVAIDRGPERRGYDHVHKPCFGPGHSIQAVALGDPRRCRHAHGELDRVSQSSRRAVSRRPCLLDEGLHQLPAFVLAAGAEVEPETHEVQLEAIHIIAGAYFPDKLHVVLADLGLFVVQAVRQVPLRMRPPERAVTGAIGRIRVVVVVHPQRDPRAHVILPGAVDHPLPVVAALLGQGHCVQDIRPISAVSRDNSPPKRLVVSGLRVVPVPE